MQQFTEMDRKTLKAVQVDEESKLSVYACRNIDAIYEYPSKYAKDVLRTQYSIDADKIIHSSLYNRGNDKTQVFSFYRNDDITRRSSHIQLVSRIGRTLGKALRLNTDLIEAIALGHDVGHTPFGHKGEEFLNELYFAHTKRYFNHNVHSVRVLQKISGCNLTLQTLDGILCHCGEKAFLKYEPAALSTFVEYNKLVEQCYRDKNAIRTLHPGTLEGCVVRISDMIAYIGKDRQDAMKAKLGHNYEPTVLGKSNSDFISNIMTDIVANSLDKPYLSMSQDVFDAITDIVAENNTHIYQKKAVIQPYYDGIKPMMELMYERFLSEFVNDDYESLIYKHYLNDGIVGNFYWNPKSPDIPKQNRDPNDVVVDFIASMTDDYFIDAFAYLFPENPLNKKIEYVEYFDKRYTK